MKNVTVTEVPVEEATAAVTNGSTKTMYWDSLDGMKPVTAAEPTETNAPSTDAPEQETLVPGGNEDDDPEAEANMIWKATEGQALEAGMTLADGLSLVFGTDDTSKPVYANFTTSADDPTPTTKVIGGVTFTGYVSSGANGSWSGTSVDPEKPTAIKYTASSDGVLTVYFDTVGSTKTICVGQDGDKKADIEAAGTKGTDAPVAFPVTVMSGETYYIYVAGSKGRFCGVAFEEQKVAHTYTWAASDDSIGMAAGTELIPGLTTLFANTSTSNKYISGSENGAFDEETENSATLKFVAPSDGTISVTMIDLGSADKNITAAIYSVSADSNIFEYTTSAEKETVVLTASAAAGETYYISARGTKGRFSAASFTEAE